MKQPQVKPVRLSLRARLALVYALMLTLSGIVVVMLTWLLVRQQLTIEISGVLVPLEKDPGSGILPPDALAQIQNSANEVRSQALAAIVSQGLIALLLVGALAAWISWLIAGKMLRPLSKITETAKRIADAPNVDRRMHERIGLSGGSEEIRELAETFDGMLARLDTSFDIQRRFIANASHELRTPLTLNRALIEVSVQRHDASHDVQLLGSTLLEVNARHERLIDGLLMLARSERSLNDRRFIDIADVVEHVVEQRLEANKDHTVIITLDINDAPTSGDPILLEQLTANLLDNAIAHNLAADGWVQIATGTEQTGEPFLRFSNSGQVIPPYELQGLFEPFRRVGTPRLAGDRGVGLGLSIVHAIVEAHGGSVKLTAPTTGGLTVTVHLPAEHYGYHETRTDALHGSVPDVRSIHNPATLSDLL